MKVLWVVSSMVMLTGCASMPKAPKLVYEDSNIAVYDICERRAILPIFDCRRRTIDKRASNVNVNMPQDPTK